MSYLTPKDVVEKLAGGLDGYVITPVKVRGLAVRDQNGYLKLVGNGAELTLNTNEAVPVGKAVEVEGIITVNVARNSVLYPAIDVKEIKLLEDNEKHQIELQLNEIKNKLRKREPYGFWNYFYSALKSKPMLKALLIVGEGAQVHLDFINGYKSVVDQSSDRIIFEHVETRLNDVSLSNTIKSLGRKYDAVFLLRGGGAEEELSRIGGYETVSAILSLDVPFYTAIGHSLDRVAGLIERVADGSFATPTMAGVELGRIVSIASRPAEGDFALRTYPARRKQPETLSPLFVAIVVLVLIFLILISFMVRR